MATAAVSLACFLSCRPRKRLLNPLQSPPLYLHITSTTKEGLESAVAKVQELIQQELPQLVDERRFRRRDQEQQPQVERDEYGRVSCPDARRRAVGLTMTPPAQMAGGEGSRRLGACARL